MLSVLVASLSLISAPSMLPSAKPTQTTLKFVSGQLGLSSTPPPPSPLEMRKPRACVDDGG